MVRGDDRLGLFGRWPAIPERWRMQLQALGYVIAGELAYLFVIFGSHKYSSLSRWIVGFYLQAFGLLVFLVLVWWERVKKRRISTREEHASAAPLFPTAEQLDAIEAWARRSRDDRDRGGR